MSKTGLVSFRQDDDVQIGHIEATSVLDAMNIAEFSNEVQAFIEGKKGIRLLLDFENVEYLSSVVLTELLRIDRKIKEWDGHLRLCGFKDDVKKVFEITNLDKVFTIYPDCKEAMIRFRRSLDIAAQEDNWNQISSEKTL